MDAFRPAPVGYGLGWPRFDARDLVIKVKYGDTLKRFNACVNGSHFDHDLPALRLKIASAFKFSPDVEFVLTYTDEDEDVVMLDDDNDLRDAAINQKLNPFRINVQLKSSSVGATQKKQQATNSKSLRSTSLEDHLAQVKSAIDEALKFVPEEVPSILANLSHDLRFKYASPAPSLAELLDRVAKLIARMHPPCGSADGSQKSENSKVKLESAPTTGSVSEPSGVQNAGISEAGLKSVLSEDPTAKIEQAPLYPSVEDSLIFTSSGRTKPDLKRSVDAEDKIKSDARSKGKSVISSVPPVSTASHGAPIQRSVPVPSTGEKTIYVPSPTYTSCGSIGMANVDLLSLFPPPPPPPPVVYPPLPVLAPYNPIPIFGANGKTTGDLHSTSPPPPNVYSPFKLNTPSSVSTDSPNLYSTGSSYREPVASLLSDYVPNPEGTNSFGSSDRGLGANYGSMPERPQHRWIQCDGCGVTPIVGPRYKSNVLDRPVSKSNMKVLERIPAVNTDSCFIKDVTVPDGTPMAPSAPFTKIWRMRNNGFTKWPYGTQLVWVGGNHLSCLSSARLAISANGGLNPCEETDVTVDFLAPAKPGRYISYWRLALPSGVKFGQQIWVHIQVEQPIQTSGDKQAAAINQNQLPEASSTRPFTFDMNSAPIKPLSGWPRSVAPIKPLSGWPRSVAPVEPLLSEWPRRVAPVEPICGWPRSSCLACETMKPKESEPASSDMSCAPAAVEPVQIPVTDAPASSAEAALASMPASVPAPETIPLPDPVPGPVSASTHVPAAASFSATMTFPVSMPVAAPAPAAPLPEGILNPLEEKLMGELEVLGFLQADLNKQVLRQNNYDLEQSVIDLCGFNEWDPLLLEELSELGSDDTEMNEEVVVDNSDDEGFIVTELVTKGKKDQ
ncbi:Protein NBR1-like protein [Dichanthelium oligosanthes]|uniref:Protein NBR1-like protein n=1 Tax=Dichanthelium oligosanthes TaxID=888268 RepID=A0A1E5UVX8_9POAL|nr:Protein NBR1-like protein [Dichanthelium oligosanthes]